MHILFIHVYIYIHAYTYTHSIYINIYIYTYTHIYICTHIYIHIHIYIYIHTYIHTQKQGLTPAMYVKPYSVDTLLPEAPQPRSPTQRDARIRLAAKLRHTSSVGCVRERETVRSRMSLCLFVNVHAQLYACMYAHVHACRCVCVVDVMCVKYEHS